MVKIQIDVRSEGDFSRRDNLYVAGGAERSDTPGYTQMMPSGQHSTIDAERVKPKIC